MTETIYRSGLEGVIAGDTTIGSVKQDGLAYRGYTIEDLAENSTFEETAYLLLHDDLPTQAQLDEFNKALMGFRALPGPVIDAMRSIPKDVSMMDVLRTMVSMAGHFDPVSGDSADDLRRRSTWLMAVIAGIIAARYRLLNDKDPVDPKAGLSHAGQILYQCHGSDPDATSTRLLDLTLILYAEHEFNASTFAARIIASTLSDMVSAVVGGIGALKGPLHGGANERAMALLKQFKNAEEASAWVQDALARKEKVMGFGHRVYKKGDHRAYILEAEMRKLAEQKGQMHWVEIYDAIKTPIVTKERPIYPNVDYPCGLTYFLMDLPLDLYTPLFVASRITGWCAHIIEQAGDNRIYRPLSRYTGPDERKVVPIDKRG
ncbi:MAG: bifunctional 2-methylcitrate synthase/citrate synthase [Planctomycetes bacterium]|nr:bifunctional 2-methylcitrate synthase/citrate synthase [Planctomycetota bacterium]